MKLSLEELAQIICGAQDTCVHRKEYPHGGHCGDCRCPAEIIHAIETGGDLTSEDMELAFDGNHRAQQIAAAHR